MVHTTILISLKLVVQSTLIRCFDRKCIDDGMSDERESFCRSGSYKLGCCDNTRLETFMILSREAILIYMSV